MLMPQINLPKVIVRCNSILHRAARLCTGQTRLAPYFCDQRPPPVLGWRRVEGIDEDSLHEQPPYPDLRRQGQDPL
jgi:hypothetical protein